MEKFYRIPDGGKFTNRQLFGIYLPFLAEQMLICLLGIVDTVLASHLNDAATAGVSYVITVDSIMKNFLSGMAAGGSVLTAQWIGMGSRGSASRSARVSLFTTAGFSLLFTAAAASNPSGTICLLVGEPEKAALGYAVDYFRISILSYPVYAVSYVCNATWRVQGNTRKPMFCSAITLTVSLITKYIYSRTFKLGISAYSLSNLTGIVISTAYILPSLLKEGDHISLRGRTDAAPAAHMLRHSLSLGLPQALENSMFQMGLLMVQRFIVTYGVVQSAANGIGKQLQPFNYLVASCWGTVCLVVVGQYTGAGKRDMAEKYTRHIMKLSYTCHALITVPCMVCCRALVSAFGGSEEALELSCRLFWLYTAAALPLYSPAWVLPSALRGGGDANFTLIASVSTMFLLRVGIAWVLGTLLGLGVTGVWIAMVTDWLARSVVFIARYRSGKWYKRRCAGS